MITKKELYGFIFVLNGLLMFWGALFTIANFDTIQGLLKIIMIFGGISLAYGIVLMTYKKPEKEE